MINRIDKELICVNLRWDREEKVTSMLSASSPFGPISVDSILVRDYHVSTNVATEMIVANVFVKIRLFRCLTCSGTWS